MKRFILRISCFIFLIVAILIFLACLFPPAPSYIDAYKHKTALLNTTESPRLIFIGGSNLAFGLNSEAIQDSLGINVVNTGLHAGIGLRSMLDTSEPYLRKGDYVIIAPEYSQFYGTFDGGEVLANLSFREGLPFIRRLNLRQLSNVIEFLPETIITNLKVNLRRSNNQSSSPLYSFKGFNQFGDFTNHWNLTRQDFKIAEIKENFDSNAADYVARKAKIWSSMGITVYMEPPVVINSYYIKNFDKINTLKSELEKRGIGFIVDPKRHVLSDTMAFDSPYHMSICGVRENTDRIIEDLRNVLN